MPPAFITCAARMKNGIDSSRNELTEAASACEIGSSISSPCCANDA